MLTQDGGWPHGHPHWHPHSSSLNGAIVRDADMSPLRGCGGPDSVDIDRRREEGIRRRRSTR